jgi:hemolysin activation/secretion protein
VIAIARMRCAVTLGSLLAFAVVPSPVAGQIPRPPVQPERPPLPQEIPQPAPPPSQILPPLPAPPPGEPPRLSGGALFVREIRIVGSTVFSAEQLAEVAAPYVGRVVSSEDLESLRLALTRLYADRGYVNSGAILPDQTVADGVITYAIVEGTLTAIEVDGTRWFRPAWFERRLARGAGAPLDVNALQRELQLLLEDPRVARLSARVNPGVRPGEATLEVQVEERPPYRLWIDVNNHQSPSIGAERGIVNVEHQNLTGNADVLTLRYGRSTGLDPLLDFRYAIPVTARDTTVSVQYRRNTSVVVEEAFRDLDIDSDSEIFTVGVRHPFYRTPSTEIAAELLGERLSDQTTVLGERFSLAPGAVDGESVVSAVRLVQEFLHRTQTQVIAARSRISIGLDVLGATTNRTPEPDSRFLAWLGQFQWVRRLPLAETDAIFRADLQIADGSLLNLEQAAVGGRYSVRGYRENTFVRDNAFITSLEARIPVVRNRRWADVVQLAPFVDYGRAWNARDPVGAPLDIASAGVGLRWAFTLPAAVPFRSALEVYWGHPFRKIGTADTDIQDDGIHFQILLGWL